mmetsp:Transcript_21014/g.48538  ORF Transcript_21014/g.48538 Transcript_21014/m.48538 type:complete len:207 (-) Transcript_21014:894-1514(-)
MTPSLRFEIGSVVAPGDRLGSTRQVSAGEGTYQRGGHVYSGIVGTLCCSDDDDKAVVSVRPSRRFASSLVLRVGQICLVKVMRLVMQQATVEIVAVEGVGALPCPHEGSIRREDVRTGASQEIQLQDCYRPGDFVLARILSLGDARRYLLTTAEPELGVIRAVGQSGKPMVALSWKEMECPVTKVKEARKCAKPSNLQQLFSARQS